MENESWLALEYLSESRSNANQRRYSAVTRFIKIYGIVPSLDRIVQDLPEREKIINNVMLPIEIQSEINQLEIKLKGDNQNPDIINRLDNLYDYAYRNQ